MTFFTKKEKWYLFGMICGCIVAVIGIQHTDAPMTFMKFLPIEPSTAYWMNIGGMLFALLMIVLMTREAKKK